MIYLPLLLYRIMLSIYLSLFTSSVPTYILHRAKSLNLTTGCGRKRSHVDGAGQILLVNAGSECDRLDA